MNFGNYSPERSCSQSHTSKSLQAYGPVCSAELLNIAAISIDIAAMCPVILFPFEFWFNTKISKNNLIKLILVWIGVTETKTWSIYSFNRMNTTPALSDRCDCYVQQVARCLDWFERCCFLLLCFVVVAVVVVVLPVYFSYSSEFVSLRCVFLSLALTLRAGLRTEMCNIWMCFHTGFIVITETKEKEKNKQILALSK